MATQIDVRDLTNTQWLFDDVVNSLGNAQFAFKLDFTSNGNTFDTIVLNIVGGEIKLYYIHNYTGPDYVYSTSTGWVNDNYKQIEITGGEHATAIGSTIAWLKQNATLIDMQINAPVIVLENNVITWGAVTNAIQYQVYKDEVLFATNTSTQRSINVFANSGTFYVVAKNENFASANSNEVVYTEKNILMHPQTNGELDKTTNLYPKTLYENIADMIDHITNEVIAGSDKLITSGAVHEAIDLASNTIRYLTVGVDDLSFNNIVSIINDGNFPIIKNGNNYYILVSKLTTKLTFAWTNYFITSGVYYSYIITYEIDNSNNITSKIIFNENKDNKKTNLTDPDNDHYPTTKAVSDGLALKQDTLSFDDTPTDGSNNPVTSDGIYEALEGKVDKETGYSLMSEAEHTKLSGVETGAQVNVLEGVQKNGTDLTITNKKVNIVVDTTFNANSTNLVQSDAIANFVNSSIATNTANFIGTFNNITALNNYSGTITNNDYANVINQELDFETTTAMNAYNKALLTNFDYGWVVNGAKYDLYRFDISTQEWSLRATNISKGDVTLISAYNRYTYNSINWEWNYTINTSGFTAAQWAAINSGIDTTKVTSYDNHLINQSNPHGVTKAQVGLGNVDNTSDATKKSDFTGSIADNNTGFATGGDVYKALSGKQDTITDGSATIASESDDIVTLKAGVAQNGGAIANSSGSDIVLNKVAKTGSYSDLSNKPIYVVDLGTITFSNGSASTTITDTQYNGLNGVDSAFVKFTVDSTVYLCLKDHKQTNRMLFFDEQYAVSVESPLNNVSTVYIQDLGNTVHNPMTSQGDLITANQYGNPVRLGIGTNGQVLASNGTTALWKTLQASDIGALPSSTKYGASLSLSINTSTYVVTLQLKDQDGNNLGSSQTIDLPLESVVVNGSYNSSTKKVVLTLQNGSTIEFSVADLVSGLQTEITSQNKLSADLVDDTNTTNKFVTSTEKTTWNGKSTVSVSDTGTATDEVNYITINGVEKKLPSGGSAITPNPSSSSTEQLEKATIGSTVYQVQNIELSNTDYVSDITLQFSDNSSETIEGVLLIENNAIYLEVENE